MSARVMPEDSTTPAPDSSPPDPRRGIAASGLAGETTGAVTPPSTASDATVLMGASSISQVIGDFEVQSKLGQGGMGAVYRARQRSLDRPVALKILPATLEADAEFVSRFQREARVAASLNHANLVKVYASGEADGSHFIAMELIEGETLGDLLKRGALPPLEALRICGDVARALDHGWQRAQLIHRDIKPGNIFLSQRGEVKVGDLGLAKTIGGDTTGLTHTGTAMGTPHYISPEQARGDKDLDFRADVYSLGCTLFQMLTGRTPYEGRDPMNVMYQHINSPPPAILKVLPGCPIPLARLVGKMLKKIKRERHGSYEELLANIETVAALFAPTETVLESTLPPDPDATLLATPGHTPRSATPVTAPIAPPAAKSKVPLYGGIAAGLAVLIGIIVAVLPKEEKLTAAERYAREQEAKRAAAPPAPEPGGTSPSASPTSTGDQGRTGARPSQSPAAEPWQDAALDPALNRGANAPKRTAEGFVLTPQVSLWFQNGPLRDGAIRLRMPFTAAGERPKLIVRNNHKEGQDSWYQAFLQNDGRTPLIQVRSNGDIQALPGGRRTDLATPLREGEMYDLEFRAVGPLLTLAVNGQIVFRGENSTVTEGGFGLQVGKISAVPIQRLEYLDLDAVSAKTTSPSTAAWTDALAAWWAGGKVNDNFVQLPGGFTKAELGGSLGYRADRPFSRDQAARVVFRLEGSPYFQVLLRRSIAGKDASHYKASLEPGEAKLRISLNTPEFTGDRVLSDVPLPAGFDPAARHTLEFRVVGDTLTAILDEKTLYTGHDPRLAQDGYPAIVARPGAIIEKFEVLNLDPPTAPAAEPWQDTLRAPGKVVLTGGAEQTPEGLRLNDSGTATIPGNLRDGAVRIRAPFGGSHPQLRARISKAGFYALTAPNENTVNLQSNDMESKKVITLRTFRLSEPLQPGRDYALELRVVGPTITAKLNGETLGSVSDGAYSDGYFSAVAWERNAAPTLIKSLEVLNLDAPTAPSAANATGVASAPWQGLVPREEWRRAGLADREFKDGLLYFGRGGSVVRQGASADGAVRAAIRFQSGSSAGLHARWVSGVANYALQIGGNRQGPVVLRRNLAGGIREDLASYEFPKPLQDGERITLELRVVGNTLTGLVNGQPVLSVKDDKITAPGNWGIIGTNSVFEGAEYLDLSASPAAAPAAAAWQPLVPAAEWQKPVPGKREFSEGLLQLSGASLSVGDGTGGKIIQPTDASVRASLRIREETGVHFIIQGRLNSGGRNKYMLKLEGDRKLVVLYRVVDGGEGVVLGSYPLPAALHSGDRLNLELRIVGDRLTGLVNGDAKIEARDDALKGPGEWGIHGNRVGVESAEYQPLDASRAGAAPTPAAATKDAPFVNSLGMKFVPVPITGGPTDKQRVLFSIWETRVQDYDAFVKETGHAWPREGFIVLPNHPAGNVSWEDAQAFCQWLTERERKAGRLGPDERYRLPTSHEWSCAVGIGDREDANKQPFEKVKKIPDVFPWGTQWPPPPGAGNYKGEENTGPLGPNVQAPIVGYRDAFTGSSPVGSFPPNAFGLHDLGGNMWEKCEDLFDSRQTKRVSRGQSYSDADREHLLASNVSQAPPDARHPNQGFRVVLVSAP